MGKSIRTTYEPLGERTVLLRRLLTLFLGRTEKGETRSEMRRSEKKREEGGKPRRLSRVKLQGETDLEMISYSSLASGSWETLEIGRRERRGTKFGKGEGEGGKENPRALPKFLLKRNGGLRGLVKATTAKHRDDRGFGVQERMAWVYEETKPCSGFREKKRTSANDRLYPKLDERI